MPELCTVERDGQILIVTINRPDKLNTINQAINIELQQVWDDFFQDPSLRVGILTAAGDRAFCVGADLAAYAAGEGITTRLKNGYGGLTHRFGTTKPIIGAINGMCLGGGLELMLCCDIVVAAEHAEFGMPEPRAGVAALGGGIPRLMRKIPSAIAMGLIMTGRRMKAAEALHYGLINEITPRGEQVEAAKRWAREVVRCAPLAVQVSKQVADVTLRGDTLEAVMAYEDTDAIQFVGRTEDAKEGSNAFLQKREPVWTGR